MFDGASINAIRMGLGAREEMTIVSFDWGRGGEEARVESNYPSNSDGIISLMSPLIVVVLGDAGSELSHSPRNSRNL